VLPALGYSRTQLEALRETIERVEADVVVAATPVDLSRLITVSKPVVRARYEFADSGEPRLGDLVDHWLATRAPSPVK
jgi:predicted GTPase